MDSDDTVAAVNELTSTIRDGITRINERLDSEKQHRENLERKVNMLKVRPGTGIEPATAEPAALPPCQLLEARTGRPIPALSHKMRMVDLLPPEKARELKPDSVGRFLRGIILGGRCDDARELEEERKALGASPDTSGGYMIGGALAAQWTDLLRSALVLSQAGAVTFPMEARTVSVAKLTADATASWHGENAALANTDPTFGSNELSAKTIYALVRYSLESSQDSANLETAVRTSMVNALAHGIDSAGLQGVAVDAGAAPSGVYNINGRSIVSGVGAPSDWTLAIDAMYNLMLANVPMDSIGAFVGHPRLWMKMRKLVTGISGDKTPLQAPPEVSRLPKIWTTANPITGTTTTKAVLAKWDDLLFGMRQQIQVKLLDQTYMGSNLQFALLAVARCDFAATRPASFCTMEGITVT
jgi:HK97 family phage major capsid protein